jgi:hypothetical protein
VAEVLEGAGLKPFVEPKPKLRCHTDVEKELRKNRKDAAEIMASLTSKGDGKPVLVPIEDERLTHGGGCSGTDFPDDLE